MRYYFNDRLLSKLHQVVDTDVKGLARMLEMDYHKLYRRLKSKDIELLLLKEICEKMRLPLGHFFLTTEDPQPLPLVPAKYRAPKVNTEYIVSLFRGSDKSAVDMSLRTINEALGNARSVMPRCVMGNITVKVSQVVEWCNTLMINLGEIIKDPICPIPNIYTVKNSVMRRELIAMRRAEREEMERVQAANAAVVDELKSRIEALERENRELRQEGAGTLSIAADKSIPYSTKGD